MTMGSLLEDTPDVYMTEGSSMYAPADPFAAANSYDQPQSLDSWESPNSNAMEGSQNTIQTDSYGNYFNGDTWVSPEGNTLDSNGVWNSPDGTQYIDGQWVDPNWVDPSYQPQGYGPAYGTGDAPYYEYGPATGTGNLAISNEEYARQQYLDPGADPNIPQGPIAYEGPTGWREAENLREQGIATGAISGDYSNFYDWVNTPIPYAEEISNVLGTAGGFAGDLVSGTQAGWAYNTLADQLPVLPSTGQVGEFFGENVFPRTVGQAALEFVPGIGTVPGVSSFADDAARLGLGAATRNLGGDAAEAAVRQGLPDLPLDLRVALGAQNVFPDQNLFDLARMSAGAGTVNDPDELRNAMKAAAEAARQAEPTDPFKLADEGYAPNVQNPMSAPDSGRLADYYGPKAEEYRQGVAEDPGFYGPPRNPEDYAESPMGREVKTGGPERTEADYGLTTKSPEQIHETYTDPNWLKSAPDVVSPAPSTFHGSGVELTTFDESYFSDTSLFGPGIYLTDSGKIAESYAEKAGSRRLGEGKFVQDVQVDPNARLLNLEQQLPQDAANYLRARADELGQSTYMGVVADAFDAAAMAAASGKRGSEVYGAFKEVLRDWDVSTSEAGEYLDELNQGLRELGYDGLAHTGGVRGGESHNVNIIFDQNKASITGSRDASKILDEGIQAGKSPIEIANDPQMQASRQSDLESFYAQKQQELDKLMAGISEDRGPSGMAGLREGMDAGTARTLQEPADNPLGSVRGPEGPNSFTTPEYQDPIALLASPQPENTGRFFEPAGNPSQDVSFLRRPDQEGPIWQEFQKSGGSLEEWINLPRSAMAGLDFSSAGRQLLPILGAHPEQYTQALSHTLKLLESEDYYWGLMKELKEESLWSKLGAQGPHMSFYKGDAFLEREEQQVAQALLGNIPGLGRAYDATGRQYSGTINAARSYVVDQFIKHRLEDFKINDLQYLNKEQRSKLRIDASRYADQISKLTGWGNLGILEKSKLATGLAQATFFSPRATIGKIEALGGLIDRPFSPVWNQNVKDLSGFLASGSALVALAVAAGATTSFDPTDTDFGKINFGPYHIDVWGGWQPFVRQVAQQVQGEKNGRDLDRNILGLINGGNLREFMVNRLSPQAGAGAYAGAKALGGQDIANKIKPEYTREGVFGLDKIGGLKGFDNVDQALQYFIPLFVQDVANGVRVESQRGGGLLDQAKGAAIGSLGGLGIGVQAYNPSAGSQVYSAQESIIKDPARFEAAGVPSDIAKMFSNMSYADMTPAMKEYVNSLIDPALIDKRNAGNANDQISKDFALQDHIRQEFLQQFPDKSYLNDPNVNQFELRKNAQEIYKLMNETVYSIKPLEDKKNEDKSSIQSALDLYNSLGQPQNGPDGKPNYDAAHTAQQNFVTAVTQRDAELGRLLQWNIDQQDQVNKNAPEIIQMYQAAQPVTNAYFGLPPNDLKSQPRTEWAEQNPSADATLWYLGYKGDVQSPEAYKQALQWSDGQRMPDVDFNFGYLPKGEGYSKGWVTPTEVSRVYNIYGDLPSLEKEQWLRDNPEANAILYLSGYRGDFLSLEAMEIAGSRK